MEDRDVNMHAMFWRSQLSIIKSYLMLTSDIEHDSDYTYAHKSVQEIGVKLSCRTVAHREVHLCSIRPDEPGLCLYIIHTNPETVSKGSLQELLFTTETNVRFVEFSFAIYHAAHLTKR